MKKNRLDHRKLRQRRMRNKIVGTLERPRMCVRISNRHIYVQFIDDNQAVSLAAISTLQQGMPKKINLAAAQELGKQAAEQALAKNIRQAVFDRGGHKYNGRVKAIAEAARTAGIKL